MLGADGETEGFGGGGLALGEVLGHFVGVVQFVGELVFILGCGGCWVLGVGFVD